MNFFEKIYLFLGKNLEYILAVGVCIVALGIYALSIWYSIQEIKQLKSANGSALKPLRLAIVIFNIVAVATALAFPVIAILSIESAVYYGFVQLFLATLGMVAMVLVKYIVSRIEYNAK